MAAVILRQARANRQHDKQAQTPADNSPDAVGRGRRIRWQRGWHNRAFDAPARIMSRLRRRQPPDVSSSLRLRSRIKYRLPFDSKNATNGKQYFEAPSRKE